VIRCFTKSCLQAKYPSYAHLSISPETDSPPKEINARTIPFLADFIKTMKKDSIVFVVAGPNMPSSLFVQQDNERKVTNQFTLKDLALSRVFYQVTELLEDDDDDDDDDVAAAMTTGTKSDFVQLMFVAPDNQTVHSVLIEFEIGGSSGGLGGLGFGGLRGAGKGKDDSLLSRSIKGLNGPPSVYSGQVAQTKRVRMICFALIN
jgi:hypothetical protein